MTLHTALPTLRHTQGGFTLIELLVALAIMSLIVGSTIAGYLTYNSQQQVFQSGSSVAAVLRTAQKRATVGDKPTTCGSNKLIGYLVTASAASNSYSLAARCQVDATTVNSFSPTDYTTLAPTIQFSTSKSILFGALDGSLQDTSYTGPSETICIGDSSWSFTITVYRTGAIQTPTAVTASACP